MRAIIHVHSRLDVRAEQVAEHSTSSFTSTLALPLVLRRNLLSFEFAHTPQTIHTRKYATMAAARSSATEQAAPESSLVEPAQNYIRNDNDGKVDKYSYDAV